MSVAQGKTSPPISQAVLAAIGAGARSYDEIVAHAGLDKKQINAAMFRLRRRGLVVGDAAGHLLTDAGRAWLASGRPLAAGQGPRVRKTAGLRERAWWLMRETQQFTLGELLTTLASGTERDADSNLRKYIAALVAVGVLRPLKRRQGGTLVIWRLVRDLGRHAPTRRKDGAVFDFNSGEVLPRLEEAGHDC